MPAHRLTLTQVMALRACGHHRKGMRHEAHRKTMRVLQEQGFVEERAPYLARDIRWFLTPAGKELLAEIGMGEPSES